MKTILINALSVSNQSGRQLLAGHIGQIARNMPEIDFALLHHIGNADLISLLPESSSTITAPSYCSHWLPRAVWERTHLNKVAAQAEAEVVFSPAGIATHGASVPQLVFCQNPWALVKGIRHSFADKLKGAVQRKAYKTTVKQADVMVFNSRFMREAYTANAGTAPMNSYIVPQGVDSRIFIAADAEPTPLSKRSGIITVSAMAPHKGIETNIMAMRQLIDRSVDTHLTLIGGWPDAGYRIKVEQLIQQQNLCDHVTILGHITDAELFAAYAGARVFCLMSRCESFGFPALEAQAFSTPTVCSDCCSMPEIQGSGGLFPPVNDIGKTATALESLLTDDSLWLQHSLAARENAQRYSWEKCGEEMIKAFRASLTLSKK